MLLLAAARPLTASAQSAVAPAQRLQAEQQAFTTAPDAVHKLIALYRIDDLTSVATPAALEGTLSALARTPNLDPLLAAEVANLQAAAQLRAGNGAAAAATWRRLGEVEHWRVVGPFDNTSPAAIATAQGPEAGAGGLAHLHFTASYEGKQRRVRWRELPYAVNAGELNLGAYLSPSKSVSAYLVSWVRSPSAQAVAVRLRDEGATRVWVNGALVFDEEGVHPSDGFDQHAAGARLAAGWNKIVAKAGDSTDGEWRFSLRLTTPAGAPLQLEDAASAPAAAIAGAAKAAAPPVRDLTAMAKQASELDYAWALSEKDNFNTGDHTAANAFEAAMAKAPEDAGVVLDFVEHDSDQSRKYQNLEKLVERGAGGARAHLDLGMIELSRGAYWPARQDFWQALGEGGNPGGGAVPPTAVLARAPLAAVGMLEAYAGMGVRPQVMAWADGLDGAGATAPGVAHPVADTLLHLGAVAAAHRWFERAYQDDQANLTTSLEWVEAERRAGALPAALATLQATLKLNGNLPNLLTTEARALSGLGRGPAALTAVRQAVALAPDNPDARVAEGEIERHFGHASAGLEAWQAALTLSPQDANLRDRVELARGGTAEQEASFERPYTQALDKTIAAFKAEPGAEQQAQENGPLVILANTHVTEVFPSGNTGRYVQAIFRINNPQGADALSVYSVTYDPATEQVRYLSAHVVHPDGTSADAPEAGDQPISQSVGYETFYDVRNKYVEMPAMRAGDFVEIAYRVLPTTLESLYGDYFGELDQFGGPAPTLFEQYVVLTPASKHVYFKAVRFQGAASEHTAGGQTVYRWSARNLPAQVTEPNAPPDIETSPYVAVSAFGTWDQFGRWYIGLIRDTFVMNDEMVQTVNQLVAGKTTEKAKAEAIYHWVIQNTHYVALEFGIHGYRPYPVTQVFHRRFGDCKDKASLLIAMLHQAGISSQFVLVRVRELGLVDPTIPSVADFDHAIVYVPDLKLYLDGTAEYQGAEELPEGDQRAFVLRVPVGADLTAPGAADPLPATALVVAPQVTPEQAATSNVSSRTLNGALDAGGNLHFSMSWIVAGGEAPYLRQALAIPDRQAGALQAILHDRLPGITVTGAQVEHEENWDQPINITMEGEIPRFATVNGSTLLIPRQIIPNAWLPQMAGLAERSQKELLGPPEIQVDTMHLALPSRYRLTRLPAPAKLDGPMASFQAQAGLNGTTLTLESRIETKQSVISPAEYKAFRAFWSQVDAVLGRPLAAQTGGGAR